MPGLRSSALLSVLLVGCGVTAPAGPGPVALEDNQRAVELRPVGDGDERELVFLCKGTDRSVAAVRSRGIRLVLGGSSPATLVLPFGAPTDAAGRLVVPCRSEQYDVRAIVSMDGGDLHVRVEFAVELVAEVRELSLAYELTGEGPADEVHAPHVQPKPGTLSADNVFRAPVGYVRRGRLAMAVLPDIGHLATERRLPQGLQLEAGDHLRHGLVALRETVTDGGLTVFERVPRGVTARGETLSFAHRLRVFADARPDATLADLFSDLWRRHVAPAMARSAAPLRDRSLEALAADAVDDLARRWREWDLAGQRVGAWLWPGDANGTMEAPFTARRPLMRTAHAMLLRARRTGDSALREQAARVIALQLSAPSRGGLTPSVLRLPPDGEPRWHIDDPKARDQQAGLADHYRSLDAAINGYWLLAATELLPEYRSVAIGRCGTLARFLIENQQDNGAFPGLYEAEFLGPHRQVLVDEPTEAAGATLFLATFAAAADDNEARQAAARGLEFLAARVVSGHWPQPFVPATADDRLRPAPLHLRGPMLTLLATGALARIEDGPGLRALTHRLVDLLARNQQVWSPPWQEGDLRGGFGLTNYDARWSTEATATAVQCFLESYRRTSSREALQRGVMALRSALGDLARTGTQSERHDRLTGAISAYELARAEVGQAIIDIPGKFAEGLDAVWFEALEVEAGRVAFHLFTQADLAGPVTVSVRPPADTGPFTLVANGVERSGLSAAELAAGVPIRAERLPTFHFAPPSQIRADQVWLPEATFDGPLPEGLKVELVVRVGADERDRVAMLADPLRPRTLITERPLDLTLPIDTVLDTRLEITHSLRRFAVPPKGAVVRLAETASIDVGTASETASVEVGDSLVRQFPDGRSMARVVSGSTPLVFRIDVPREATSLKVWLRVHGAARIDAQTEGEPVLLHEDEDAQALIRELEFTLTDRRLWSDETLSLALTPSGDAPLSVARVRYRYEGQSQVQSVGEVTSTDALSAPLRIAVVPLKLRDAPTEPNAESLQQLFFGGPEYAVTPEPESRRTSGSVGELLAAISGGRSAARGEVLDARAIDASIATLEADPATIEKALRQLIEERGGPAPDVIVGVHSAADPGRLRPSSQRGPRVVLLPERSTDGSYLSVGRALTAILDARFGFETLDGPEHGNFGALALSGGGDRHVPAGPAGVNLARTGWADIVHVNRTDHVNLRIAPLQVGRAAYVLSTDLRDRGELWLETRRGGPGDPGIGEGGVLAYWQLPNRVTIRAAGVTTETDALRLSPTRSVIETARTPGDPYRDLLRRAVTLDGASRPSLATPQGEVPWTIHDLRTIGDGQVELRLRYRILDAMPTLQGVDAVWSTGPAGQVMTPLASDDRDRGLGLRANRYEGLYVKTAAAPGSAVRADLPTLRTEESVRLFGNVARCFGEVTLTIGVGPDEVTHFDLSANSAGAFVLDLPSTATAAPWIRVTRRGGAPIAALVLDKLALVPRARASQQIRDRRITGRRGVRLMDGSMYGNVLTLEPNDDREPALTVPVILPRGGGMLRLVAGLPRDSQPGQQSTVTLRLRRNDGSPATLLLDRHAVERIAAPQPLLVALIELPAPGADGEKGVAQLDAIVEGAALRVVTFEVSRP